MLIYTHVAAVN